MWQWGEIQAVLRSRISLTFTDRPLSQPFKMTAVLFALSNRFRRRRMQRFAAELGITTETRVLDIGGAPDCWRLLLAPPRVTLLNTPRAKGDLAGAAATLFAALP